MKSNPPDTARLRQLSSDLQQMAFGLSAAASGPTSHGAQAAGARSDGPGGGPNGGRKPPGSEDDVIDAEFKRAG